MSLPNKDLPIDSTIDSISKMKIITFKSILKFFLPLAATPFMIGLTHSIINAALARLPYPDLSIAVFTVSKGLISIVSMPTLMSLQLILTFVDNKKSFKKTITFIFIMGFSLFSILLLVTYTPLGKWIFRYFFSLKEEQQINFAMLAMPIGCFLPLVQILRNSFQGMAVGLKQTKLLIPGVVIRLITISIFLVIVVKTQFLLGIVAGSLAWIIGIGIEGLMIIFMLKYVNGSIEHTIEKTKQKNNRNLTHKELFKFFLPLGIMMSLAAFLQPTIQSGIARSSIPTQSLAAYGVAWSIVILLSGPLGGLHQISIVFVNNVNDINWNKIKLFSFFTGLAITGIIFILGITEAGNFLFHNIVGVSLDLTLIARKVLLAFALSPLIRSFREAYVGLLMKRRTTLLIGIGKTINIFTVFIIMIGGISVLPFHPAVTGGFAFSCGELIETITLWYYARKKNKLASPS